MPTHRVHRRLLASVAACLSATSPAFANTITTVVAFNDADGSQPFGGLVVSGNNFYGTTYQGGSGAEGTVFSVPVAGGTVTTLVTFNTSNGSKPEDTLLLSGSTLYGTTLYGGTNNDGTVFSVPVAGGALTTLANFNNSNGGGGNPIAGLIQSGNTLYGAAYEGGTGVYYGAIYSLPTTGISGSGAPTTLASFNGTNGANVEAEVILSGNTLYGTSYGGGPGSYGTVFSTPAAGGPIITLATFNNSNGSILPGGVILIGNTFYGTSLIGGANGDGVVYSVPVTGGTPTVLGNFNSSTGINPSAPLTLVGNTLYGTTSSGGANNDGTVFSIPITGGTITTVATFNGSNGMDSYAGLTFLNNTLYGTTYAGGPTNDGVVFGVSLVTVVASGQTYHFPANNTGGIAITYVPGLTVQAGGEAVVDPAASHANRQLLIITGLTLDGSTNHWTGLVDLTNNDLDLPAASLATVTNQAAQGYNAGNWNSAGGIISSSAAAASGHLTALGVIQNNQGGTALYTATNPFDGTTPGATDILVKYTYYGDANLDGRVDGSDYTLIDNGYLNHLTGWYNGDFNYDGVVNGSDYTLIDNAFNTQGASLTAQIASSTAQIASTTAVPEPACLSVATIAIATVLRRRRIGPSGVLC